MTGPAPKDPATRRRRNAPAKGEMVNAPGVGWQHGRRPKCPPGLMPESRVAWETWFASWFAAFWTPADVPALRQMVKLYDLVERGADHRYPELRLQYEMFGVTPKGQLALRWKPPIDDPDAAPAPKKGKAAKPAAYGHLKAVD